MNKKCEQTECEHYEEDNNNNCSKMMLVRLCLLRSELIAKTAPVAEVPCSDRVMLPLLLADELLEECWNATSKLESQLLRNADLPKAYAEIVDKSFAALRKLQAARMAT